jgi:hypothetical protein
MLLYKKFRYHKYYYIEQETMNDQALTNYIN